MSDNNNDMKRSKKFTSFNSLKFENKRLETFIDWPVSWLKPNDLARDGFIYLRTLDHCACVFCRGKIGSWEEGDTPPGEHKKHFPHCPFVKGESVGNVPLSIENALLKQPKPESTTQGDICGTGRDVCGTGRHMFGSFSDKSKSPFFTSSYYFYV